MNAKSIRNLALILLLIIPISTLASFTIPPEREPPVKPEPEPEPGPASPSPPRTIGSYMCPNGCTVGFPRPDKETIDIIIEKIRSFNLGKTREGHVRVGDVIIICNGAACVRYRWIEGGRHKFYGEKHDIQIHTPPVRDARGDRGREARLEGRPRGGSRVMGSGATSNGGGQVRVGPITKAQ